MEHVVHICKVGGKLELIGEIASLADDLERTHVSRGKLPFDTEVTSTFHWRDAEVNMVSDIESQIMMLTIIVALLARLRCFEVITNDFAHLFCLYDQVISKKLTFTGLRPVKRSMALPAIENFKWGLARTCLKTVVVGELSIRKTILPFHAEGESHKP